MSFPIWCLPRGNAVVRVALLSHLVAEYSHAASCSVSRVRPGVPLCCWGLPGRSQFGAVGRSAAVSLLHSRVGGHITSPWARACLGVELPRRRVCVGSAFVLLPHSFPK